MATGEIVDKAVLQFAQDFATQNNVAPPEKWSDTINPAFSSLSQNDFLGAWKDLHVCLTQNGVESDIGIEQMKSCATWRTLSNTVFDEQPIG